MSETSSSFDTGPGWTGLEVTPVLPEDPAKIGGYWLDGRLGDRPSGTAWLAHGDGLPGGTGPGGIVPHGTGEVRDPAGQRVVLVQLSEGAATDKAARDRFSGLVNHLHIDAVVARGGQEQEHGRLGKRFRATDDHPVDPDEARPLAPWVALAYVDDPAAAHLADHLLAEVDLLDLPPPGPVAGPDFRLHWIDRDSPGHNRVWPLPWPGRHDRAGWVTIFVSWLLTLLLTAIAVLIAILIFSDSPPQSPPPQAETPQASPASPDQAESEPASQTPEQSPSPGDGSPTSTEASPTPEPSGSAAGSPTPPSRL